MLPHRPAKSSHIQLGLAGSEVSPLGHRGLLWHHVLDNLSASALSAPTDEARPSWRAGKQEAVVVLTNRQGDRVENMLKWEKSRFGEDAPDSHCSTTAPYVSFTSSFQVVPVPPATQKFPRLSPLHDIHLTDFVPYAPHLSLQAIASPQ